MNTKTLQGSKSAKKTCFGAYRIENRTSLGYRELQGKQLRNHRLSRSLPAEDGGFLAKQPNSSALTPYFVVHTRGPQDLGSGT